MLAVFLYLHQLDNVYMVQLFEDGDLLVDPLQRSQDLGLLPLGGLGPSWWWATCRPTQTHLSQMNHPMKFRADRDLDRRSLLSHNWTHGTTASTQTRLVEVMKLTLCTLS